MYIKRFLSLIILITGIMFLTGTYSFAKRYDPDWQDLTMQFHKYLAKFRKAEMAIIEANTIKNHTFLKEIFAVTGEPETPYEILRKYDYFSETNNMLGDVLDQLNAISELYPDPEQVQELATFKIGELKVARDKLAEWRGNWTQKVNDTLTEAYGMSISRYEQVKDRQDQVLQYFKDLQTTAIGTNSLREVKMEQDRMLYSLGMDSLAMKTALVEAIAATRAEEDEEDMFAWELHKKATNVEGWDKKVQIRTRSVNPHWRD